MSQQTALIVHQLMDAPEGFIEDNGIISNGYYKIALDGTRYGMGAAMYQCDGAERDMMQKAIGEWKLDTGWVPKEVKAAMQAEQLAARPITTPDTFIRKGYEEFAKAVRSNLKSFMVHSDPNVLKAGLQQAVEKLDQVICPMEKIEGKRNDAKEGGIPSS